MRRAPSYRPGPAGSRKLSVPLTQAALCRPAVLCPGLLVWLLVGTTGCGTTTLPLIEPGAPPPPSERHKSPEQFRVEPPQREGQVTLEELPTPPRRMAVYARETTDGLDLGEDRLSLAIMTEALQAEKAFSPPRAPRFEVVSRQVYEDAMERDAMGLQLRDKTPDAEILRNLAEAGVDLFVLGDIDRRTTGGPGRPTEQAVDAAVSIVRVDDATVLGTGSGSARGPLAKDAKKLALTDAVREALHGLRSTPPPAATLVTLTVEGLREERDAARLEKTIRVTRGVMWLKPPRFQLGPDGGDQGVCRYEIGWSGDTEELKSILREVNDGFRLEGSLFEGNRWSFRAQYLTDGTASVEGQDAPAEESEAQP